nr:hypothetical protein [Clostridia bacterium]
MKKLVRLLVLALLTFTITFGSFACGGGPKPWEGKTIIEFGCYQGGWGREWLDKAIEKFQEMYPEYYVKVDYEKSYEDLQSKIVTGKQDIFYAGINLYDFLEQDEFMDITDVMTTPLNEYLADSEIPITETKTIESKMTGTWQDMKDYCLSYDGHYYNVPFGGGLWTLNYNRDLFNRKKLFKDKDGDWCKADGDLTVGQDGVAGTYDDGLPVTYEDFTELLEQMSEEEGMTPFFWSYVDGYTKHFAHALGVAQDGKDVFNIFKTMNGSYDFDGDGIAETAIDNTNAWKLRNTSGRKFALQFCKDVIENGYYDSQSGKSNQSHLTSQKRYVQSEYNSKRGGNIKPIAFFIDGGHWHNEAEDVIAQTSERSGEDIQFGVMPFPWFEGCSAEKTTYYISSQNSTLCIRKNATEPEGCKKLLAFLNTDEMLVLSTKTSGIVRFMNYEMSETDLAAMPYYYQSTWEAAHNSDICYTICANEKIFRNFNYFNLGWEWDCTAPNGLPLNNPLENFKASATSSVTVQQYFNALYSAGPSEWSKNVK